MHVFSLRGINFGFWSHVGCSRLNKELFCILAARGTSGQNVRKLFVHTGTLAMQAIVFRPKYRSLFLCANCINFLHFKMLHPLSC